MNLHGGSMEIAVLLHVLSLIVAIGSSFCQSFKFGLDQTAILGVTTAWMHEIPGGFAILLGVPLVSPEQ